MVRITPSMAVRPSRRAEAAASPPTGIPDDTIDVVPAITLFFLFFFFPLLAA